MPTDGATANGEDTARTITLRFLVAYAGGAIVILLGLATIVRGPGGLFMLLAGVFALPPVRREITNRTGISFSSWLVAVIVVLVVVVGMATLPDSPDTVGGAQADAGTNGGGTNPETERIVDETVFSSKRYPVDASAGATFHFEVNVREGGPFVIVVSSQETDEPFRKRIDTQDSFSHTVETDGVYYIQVAGSGEAQVTVTRE